MKKYKGPIEVGMPFLWEPFKPHATEHIIVTSVETNSSDNELRIECRSYIATSKVDGNYTGKAYWNDESRFREAVMLVKTLKNKKGEL